MLEFFIYVLGYLLIFAAIDLGRVESEKFGLFTKIGFIQYLMVLAGTMLLAA